MQERFVGLNETDS